eukprot:s1888_g3.t1
MIKIKSDLKPCFWEENTYRTDLRESQLELKGSEWTCEGKTRKTEGKGPGGGSHVRQFAVAAEHQLRRTILKLVETAK